MTIHWPQFIWGFALLGGWSSALIGIIWLLLRYSITQFQKSLDERHKDMEKAIATSTANYQRLDSEFKALLVRLPIDYQRREDSIREYTVMNAKLDRIAEITLRKNP